MDTVQLMFVLVMFLIQEKIVQSVSFINFTYLNIFFSNLFVIVNQHLVSGQSEFNSVETNTWKYYNIDVEEGESLYITVTQDNASYDVDVVSIFI